MERANSNLTHNVKNIWLSCFPDESKNIEGFFNNGYKAEDTLVEITDNRVVSFLTRTKNSYMLNGRIVKASTIVGVGTLAKYRNMGYVKNMLSTMCDIFDHTELISFATTRNKELFEKFGFKTIYKRNRYRLTRENIQRITNDGCYFDPSSIDMIKLYSSFLKRFNGYRVRTLKEFDEYKKSIYDRGGKIVAYYEENILKGYASLVIKNKEIEIEECIYLDTISLFKLLNVALQQRHVVNLNVSEIEDLSLLISGVIPELIEFKMARLNNKELFNRLYNCNVKNVEDAFFITGKPLYQSEEF